MKKLVNLSYICLVIGMVAFASCQSNETRKQVKAATPSDPVIINKTTTTRLDKVDEGFKSGMTEGYAWVNGNGVFVTITEDNENPDGKVENETTVGGRTQSNGRVLLDTIPCGESFIDPVFTLTGDPTTEDISNADSIGAKTVKSYTGTDGQQLTLEDLYKYLSIEATLPTPRFEASSKIAEKNPVRFDETNDENVRIVWIKVEVKNEVEGTVQGEDVDQSYEVGYVQTKTPAVTPEKDPYEVRIKDFQLFRTYRKKTQHSICEGFLSFGVYNTKTGELVEEISTDQFSMQLGKTGHFGAPTNGYIVGEARLVGSAPTSVKETPVADNEEAQAASHQVGNFTVSVSCTAQDYYVHFPVRGRDDSEGGMEAGGQNLFFEATLTYSRPATATEPAWTKTWSFTHSTEVKIKGWETRTPQVDRTGETVNDVDGERKLKYAGTYVVEFINHLYLDGEEIVYTSDDEDNDEYYLYHPVSQVNGNGKSFHTSEMAIDCWTSYLP